MNTLHPHDGPIFEELVGLEITFAKTQQDVYIPLRAITDHTRVITRWEPTPEQRAAIAAGDDIFLECLTFGSKLQPVRLTVGMTLGEALELLHLT